MFAHCHCCLHYIIPKCARGFREASEESNLLVWELPQQELMHQARVKNWLGKAKGNKNKLMWLCHKEPSSPDDWTETKNISVTFLSGSLWEHGGCGRTE